MTDTTPSEAKTLMEFKAKKSAKAAAPETLQDRVNDAFSQQAAGGGSSNDATGAAEAAGVLTAIDEDGEGAEEADTPGEFEYHSDGGEED